MKPVIRKAKIDEVKKIQSIVNFYAAKGDLLSRSLNELYESIRDFFVCEIDGEIAGACSLHINWEDLAEIRSMAVKVEYGNRGIGTRSDAETIEHYFVPGTKSGGGDWNGRNDYRRSERGA